MCDIRLSTTAKDALCRELSSLLRDLAPEDQWEIIGAYQSRLYQEALEKTELPAQAPAAESYKLPPKPPCKFLARIKTANGREVDMDLQAQTMLEAIREAELRFGSSVQTILQAQTDDGATPVPAEQSAAE